MKIAVVGGGPAGLYFAILMKKARPATAITVFERNAADEHLIQHLQALGVLSVARKENPRRLEMLLNSALPPESKVRFFE